MKNPTKLLILMAIVFSCNSKPVKENKPDRGDLFNTLTSQELTFEKEKIYLLSLASKVPYDTVRLIIKDYKLNEYNRMINKPLSLTDSSIVDYQESIQSISRKYRLSESKVASLVFSFKYEMRSPDEIVEEYQGNQVDDREYEER